MAIKDYTALASQLNHVKSELSRYAGIKESHSGRTFILCPFHGERTPSGQVDDSEGNRFPGRFYCYGCGAKANWNTLAPLIGLEPFERNPLKPAEARPMLFSNLAGASDGPDFDENIIRDWKFSPLPKDKVWREIKTNLLIDLGAKLCRKPFDDGSGYGKKMIWLPVYVNKNLVGFSRARLKKEADKPSYLNAPGQWTKTHGLFPLDYSAAMAQRLGLKTIVLVEGQRDALRLLSNDIPAVCIHGTQSWSKEKAQLLEISGFEHVITMMDGDCAGKMATDLIEPTLDELFTKRIIRLWAMKSNPYYKFRNKTDPSKACKKAGLDPWDPGNVPQSVIEKVKLLLR